jgi:glycosyltransferase involved in cell wall biosynthesis
MSERLPRLLILSHVIPQTVCAGSIVLQRLLGGYPPEQLRVVGPAPHPSAQVLSCQRELLRLPLQRLERTRFARMVRSLRVCGLLPGPRFRYLAPVVADFRPEVVVTVMEVQAYYHLAYRYASKHRLPLVLIVHDLAELFEPVYGWARRRQQRATAQVYRYARRRLCVSPEMCRRLEGRYGVPGDVLYPSRGEDLTPRPAAEALRLKNPPYLTLGYAGALGYGYEQQLEAMIPAFGATGTRLHLYGKDKPSWADVDVVNYRGFAPVVTETWARVKAECDALLLPYSWSSGAQKELFRTHFPSKLTEYLALGMPVLIVGPPWATGVRWGLVNARAALTIADSNPAAWTAALEQLRVDAELRRSLSEEAVLAGDRDFHPGAIRQCFLEHLCAVVADTGGSIPGERT